jgi:hypothetical protein
MKIDLLKLKRKVQILKVQEFPKHGKSTNMIYTCEFIYISTLYLH